MRQQDPEEYQENQPPVAAAEDMEAAKQALATEQAKSEANLAGWQRAQADFINYKRRQEQERENLIKLANTTLMHSILPILDDLERALGAIPPRLTKHDWVNGIKLIDRKLRTNLELQGLTPIKALGEPFDPNVHQAVRQDCGEEGIVIAELERGYKLHDRVIWPTKVVVGNGNAVKKEE